MVPLLYVRFRESTRKVVRQTMEIGQKTPLPMVHVQTQHLARDSPMPIQELVAFPGNDPREIAWGVPPMRRSYGVLPMRLLPMRRHTGQGELARGQPTPYSTLIWVMRSMTPCRGRRLQSSTRRAWGRERIQGLVARLAARAPDPRAAWPPRRCTAARSSQDSRNSFLWFTTDPSRFNGTHWRRQPKWRVSVQAFSSDPCNSALSRRADHAG